MPESKVKVLLWWLMRSVRWLCEALSQQKKSTVLLKVVTSIQKANELNEQIASASQEQAQSLEQINKAIIQLDQATQSNAASAEQTAATSEELSSQSEVLRKTVVTLTEVIEGRTNN